jgi:V-type H+-transporting ATPase subunit H
LSRPLARRAPGSSRGGLRVLGRARARALRIASALRRAAKPELGLYWHELLRNSGAEVDPFAPIMRLLGRTNAFILEKSALVLGRILSLKIHTLGVEVEETTEATEVTQRHLLTFTEWIFHQLNSAHSLELAQCPKLHYALSSMMALVVSDHGRHAVMDINGLSVIVQMLARATSTMHDAMSPSTVQLLYQLVFCLWCLSYNKAIAEQMATGQLKVIPQLVHVANAVSKEKVSRVCLMTLKNLLGHGKGQMVQSGIMKVLGSLGGRKWADDDIATDIEQLNRSLEVDVASLSTFDVYKAEVLSGSLEWSPSHKSPKFWKDNIHKFSEGSYAIVSSLVAMIKVRAKKLATSRPPHAVPRRVVLARHHSTCARERRAPEPTR